MKCLTKPQKRCEDIVDFLIKSDSAIRELNIKTLAKMYGLNRTYLARTFKKYQGKDLGDYINLLKLLKSSLLLIEKPYLKIWEIAEFFGWNRSDKFIKAFKKFSGVTPGYFRKFFNF